MKDLQDMVDESRRFRSPSFRKDEVEALVELVSKYKSAVLNKSTTSAASQIKDAAWTNIAIMFNQRRFKHFRTPNVLKTKWENIKRSLRSSSAAEASSEYGHLHEQVVSLVTESNELKDDKPLNVPPEVLDTLNDRDLIAAGKSENNLDTKDLNGGLEDQDSEKSGEEDYSEKEEKKSFKDQLKRMKAMRRRSSNFSPDECSLLLRCVRAEKDIIFNTKTDSINNFKKLQAWKRVTNSYNKFSPRKRTGTMLVRKFWNLKKIAKKIGNSKQMNNSSNQASSNLSVKKIKKEPAAEFEVDVSFLSDDEQNMEMEICNNNISMDSTCHQPDPLTLVSSQESVFESPSSTSTSTCNVIENVEVTKLKLQLLNYKLETAKIERRRLEETAQSETAEREMRAKETALRLRAARLEATAAEMKLPLNHPALQYMPDEVPAQGYMHHY